MDNFTFFYLVTEQQMPDDWRQKTVWHRTKTGQRNKVKVKSLPPDEQWKYAPLEVKMKRKRKDPQTSIVQPQQHVEKPVITFYYSADRPDGYDNFENGKLVMATDDSAKAIEIEKQGHKIAVAHGVPVEAVRGYWNYEKKDWDTFPKDVKPEKKYELIQFSDDDVYVVDFFGHKDEIDFQLSDPEGPEENEDE